MKVAENQAFGEVITRLSESEANFASRNGFSVRKINGTLMIFSGEGEKMSAMLWKPFGDELLATDWTITYVEKDGTALDLDVDFEKLKSKALELFDAAPKIRAIMKELLKK